MTGGNSTIEIFKDNIHYFRKKHNMSQQQLAESCGMSTFYIAELERGKKTPSLSTVDKLAQVFNIPVYMMFLSQQDYKNDILKQFCDELETDIHKIIKDFKGKH